MFFGHLHSGCEVKRSKDPETHTQIFSITMILIAICHLVIILTIYDCDIFMARCAPTTSAECRINCNHISEFHLRNLPSVMSSTAKGKDSEMKLTAGASRRSISGERVFPVDPPRASASTDSTPRIYGTLIG